MDGVQTAMDYERINHKVQMGVISPSKLRMKLLGATNSRKKEGGSNSSRTSPSKLEELQYAKNHLLDFDPDDEATSIDLKPIESSVEADSEVSGKQRSELVRSNSHNVARTGGGYQVQAGSNLSTVHPVRSYEESGNGYDGGNENRGACGFEFHRSLHHPAAAGPFVRHVPSKWNNAEKWIVSRQSMQSKKNVPHCQGSWHMSSNLVKNVHETNADTKRIDPGNAGSQNVMGKFSFIPQCIQPKLLSASGVNESARSSQVMRDSRNQGRFEKEQDHEASVSENPVSAVTANQPGELVSMRDIGTEMTPIPSQEPSKTATPIEATTPSRSPRSSTPTTPKRGGPESYVHGTNCQEGSARQELSEKELKLKTRREIAALGVQLGKMNIASWASKEAESASPSPRNFDEQRIKAEYEARAAAWEEAENAKLIARYKREELKIQAWENHQRAKVEAKIRKLEVRVERIKARGQEKITRKLAETRRQVEERQADAAERKNQKAAWTAHRVEKIRQTGQVPPSHVTRCSWLLL